MSVTRKITSTIGSILGRKIGDILGQKLEAAISFQRTDESDKEESEAEDESDDKEEETGVLRRITAVQCLQNTLKSAKVNVSKMESEDESKNSDENDGDEEVPDTKSESDNEVSLDEMSRYLDDMSGEELQLLANQLADELDERESE